MSATEPSIRLPLLKSLKDLAKSGAKLDASIVTTFAFNGLFYEEVLLRAFERAGSRLNIVLVDAAQLAESMSDPLRRPTRAGVDYLLAPIAHRGAFHPKIVALLSEKQPFLALGSHNATDAGYTHNEELTAFWGSGRLPPASVLREAVGYAVDWLRHAAAVPEPVLNEIAHRLQSLLPTTASAANEDVAFVGSRADACLWDQVRAKIHGTVQRVAIVGPYFDGEAAFLRAIDASLGPVEIVVGIQPDTAVLPRPDLAPANVRFVDASALNAFWPKADEIGFAHGKAVAIETTEGFVVSVGSANPTGAAWLAQDTWNAEANLCLMGESAADAFNALGLDHLSHAPSLGASSLAAIAERSQKLRRDERAAGSAAGPPLLVAAVVEDGVFLPGFSPGELPELRLVSAPGAERAAVLSAGEGGSLLHLSEERLSGGIYRLQSLATTVAFVLVNDDQALRAASLPRESARILDHLGALDSNAGFTDLLDLLDKHVLGPSESSFTGASRPQRAAADESLGADDEAPFGPRGVSLPLDAESASHRRRLSDGLIADIISALIRALGAPPQSETDGDAPDLDEGDAIDEPSSDQLARSLEARPEPSDIDWPRLVTACRKRLTVMIRRLEARMVEAASGDHSPSWALGRLVVVLSLLQRLRVQPPQTGEEAISGRVRPTSLVSLDQLRAAFGVAIGALYGAGKVAVQLEMEDDTRAAEERRLIDNLLLWFARELGADYRSDGRAAPDARTLQARADLGLVAMSAAAHPKLEAWAEYRDPWLSVWDDALSVPADWTSRQMALGALLHSLRGVRLPSGAKPPRIGDLVQWAGEWDLPWVVGSVSGHKVTLIEPARPTAEKKVLLNSVTALDIDSLLQGQAQTAA